MNRRLQHLLSAGASVLAIGVGAVAANAAVTTTTEQGASIAVSGGVGGVWDDSYALTDLDAATVKPATEQTGVVTVADAGEAAQAYVNSVATGYVTYNASVTGIGSIAYTNPKGGSFTTTADAKSGFATGAGPAGTADPGGRDGRCDPVLHPRLDEFEPQAI